MNRLAAIAALLWLSLPSPALAAPLIADLSNYRIDMDASFNGTRIFLFGARSDNGDVIVVVRGPEKHFMVRKKESMGGIWVNRGRMKFYNVPNFYAIASSKPMKDIPEIPAFSTLGIGEANLFMPTGKQAGLSPFAAAFLDHQYEQRLFTREPGTVQFMGGTLFKTVIEFPDNIPPGDYTAEIYLVSDGEIVGMQSTPIKVVKTGLDALLYTFAHQFPAWYGLTAIALALAAGWVTGRLFEK